MSIADLARRYRRALRNDQGTRLTAGELRVLAELGTRERLSNAENEELKSKWQENASTLSANSG